MPRIPGLRRIFRLDGPARDVERDVDDELAFHFAEKARELEASGLSPEQALREAERRFGDAAHYRAALATIDRGHRAADRRAARVEAIVEDTRYAARSLLRRPGFSLAIVVMLGLGIGANALMFGVVDRLLFRAPPHVMAPEQLRDVHAAVAPARDGSTPMGGVSLAFFRDLEASLVGHAQVAASVGGMSRSEAGNMTLGVGDDAQPVRGLVVTGGYLPMLGVRPTIGRLLLPADDTLPGAAPAAVIGYSLWQRRFGGASTVLGTPVRVDGAWYTIAGVLPPDFRGVDAVTPDVWLPLGPAMAAAATRPPGSTALSRPRLHIVARLHEGASEAAATTRASAVFAAAADASGDAHAARAAELAPLRPLMSRMYSQDARVSVLVAAVSVLLLLIACASVANLLLARALERSREIAVRLALGVSRRRLALQILGESILLAGVGGVAALGVVRWGAPLLQTLLLGATGATERPVDGRVLAFTLTIALVTGLLAGIVPAIQASRPSLTGALRRGVQDGGGRRTRTRTVLAAVQMTLCVVLLVGTGLFVSSLREVLAVPLGFDGERVLAGSYGLDGAGSDSARVQALFAEVTERVTVLPGVSSVATSDAMPLELLVWAPIHVDGDPKGESEREVSPIIYRVSPKYFSTLGIRLLRGRDLTDEDRAGAPLVTVVSEAMANEYWPGRDPIGGCVRLGVETAPCRTVVGVVEDIVPMQVTEEFERPQYYLPLAQTRDSRPTRALFVRPTPDAHPPTVAAAVRRVMQESAPDLPFATVVPLAAKLERELRPWRLGATLFGAFGALALVVAATGLYGVLAFGVAQRRHEMGVRLALGATSARVVRLVLLQGIVVAAVGAAIGLALAAVGAPFVADLLYRTSPHDPLTFAAVATVLLVVALVASLAPAWRASRVPPATALRAE